MMETNKPRNETWLSYPGQGLILVHTHNVIESKIVNQNLLVSERIEMALVSIYLKS